MKELQHHSKALTFEQPLITAEGSQLAQMGLPVNNMTRQTSPAPDWSYKAEASMGRPSTARSNSKAAPHRNNPICPSPVVRRSEDNIDVHEALRFQLPPFRQSRRWAKTYMDKDEAIICSSPLIESSTSKFFSPLVCDTFEPSLSIPGSSYAGDNVSISDNESDYRGFCGPRHVPGWHVIKRHRFLRRSATSLRATSSVSPRNLQSKQPTRFTRAQVQPNPHRASLPKAVKSKGSLREEKLSQNTPGCVAKHRKWNGLRNSPVSDISDATVRIVTNQPSSPVSPLHVFEKVKRFSQECVDMLSGLDFGEEWRLSIVAPELSIPQQPSCNASLSEQAQSFGQINQRCNIDLPTTSRQDTKTANELLTLMSNEASGISRGATPAELFRLASARLHHGSPATNTDSVVEDKGKHCSREQVSFLQVASSKTDSGKQMPENSIRNLKNARSIDTLSQIEAQVDDSPTRLRQVGKKESSFTLSSSPKHQRPAGEPPERPLPDLPTDDTSDNQSAIHRRPSFAGSRKSRTILDTLELADPFRSSSVQTIIPWTLSNARAPQLLGAGSSNDLASSPHPDSGKGLSGSGPSFSQGANGLLNMNAQSRILKAKDTVSDRNSKVREMKKRDVAARGQSTSNRNSAMQPIDSGYESGKEIAQRPAPPSTKQMEDHVSDFNKESHHTLNTPRNPAFSATTYASKDRSNLILKSNTSRESTEQLPKAPIKVTEEPKQRLDRSRIMVIVDTNPHASSFRASALSPSPSSRPSTAFESRSRSRLSCADRGTHCHTSSADFDNLAELVDIIKPSVSMKKRRSSRSLRPHGSTSRNSISNAACNTSDRALSVTTDSRGRSRTSYHRLIDSSDSDMENSPFLKDSQISTQARKGLKSSVRKSHLRSNTPLTNMLKEEVFKADVELENLKRNEQRIEYLQLHLEQTLKVWGRMSQNGKKQYLASTFAAVKGVSNDKPAYKENENEVASIVSSSTYSKRSSVRRLDDAVGRPPKEALDFASRTSDDRKRISCISAGTQTTDAGTDGSADTDAGILGKRASGGSLTDPQDYDLPHSSSRSSHEFSTRDSPARKTGIDSMGTDLDSLRARLQASRGPVIPARRCKLRTPSCGAVTVKANKKNSVSPPSNRFAIAPWEEYEVGERNAHDVKLDADMNDRMSLHLEPFRTDQMDAMLAF